MIDAADKFDVALRLQEQGIPRQEIWKQLGYSSLDPLTKMFRKKGYTFDKASQKYKPNDEVTTPVKKPQSTTQKKQSHPAPTVTTQQLDPTIQKNILELANNYNIIKDMIEWYKEKAPDKCNTEVIHVIQGLQIDLPPGDNVMVSTRSNKTVWELFNKFCVDHSNYKKGDLLAQALLDFINAHS